MAETNNSETSQISVNAVNPENETQPNPNKARLIASQRLGHSIVGIAIERERSGFMPFLSSNELRRFRDITSLAPIDNPSDLDVLRARVGSFSIALRAAHLISRADIRARGVHEDPNSLSDLKAMIAGGISEGRELANTDKESVIDAIKRNIAETYEFKQAQISPDSIGWDDEKVLRWGMEQFNNAYVRLAKSIDHLTSYSF